MSPEYYKYLQEHRAMVVVGYEWLITHHLIDFIKEVLTDLGTDSELYEQFRNHDKSKYDKCECEAYDEFFYGPERTQEVIDNFNYAWLNHIHSNPHHWQHWVLIFDKGGRSGKQVPLDMPDNYILEMICDWWSFSWRKATKDFDYKLPMIEEVTTYKELDLSESTVNRLVKHEKFNSEQLFEMFDWYKNNKSEIIFSETTEDKVEKVLKIIYKALIVWHYNKK